MTRAYDWDFVGFGGTLARLSDGASVWLHGEESLWFDRDWDACETDEQCDMLASAYDDVMEVRA